MQIKKRRVPMFKKVSVLALIAVFVVSVIGCGHLKRPFKHPRKKKGHYKGMIIDKTQQEIASINIYRDII
jgi:hypothetical protein